MLKVVLTEAFERWLDGLRDPSTRRRLALRIHSMYYARRGDVLILMLGGGTKASQAGDIAKAMALAEMIEE